MLSFGVQYNAAYCSNEPANVAPQKPDSIERQIVCKRAAQEMEQDVIINLGIGMPEGVAKVAPSGSYTITVESGPIGGVPAGGLDFGCSANPEAIIDQPYQFDFYQGGGLDIAFLGLAQTDMHGNVNVSKFGPKIAGCGGFIDITQTAKKVVYCGTFTAKGLKIECADGKLSIVSEGSITKFVRDVEQITFSGRQAMKQNQPVLYITERAVFELTGGGMMLIEIAPGIDLENDVLAHMDFVPIVSDSLKEMDSSLFE
jgi:propionate CoA-transferase